MANSEREHFKFLTPLDYVKDRRRNQVADEIEEHIFVTSTNDNVARATPDEKTDKFYLTNSSNFHSV